MGEFPARGCRGGSGGPQGFLHTCSPHTASSSYQRRTELRLLKGRPQKAADRPHSPVCDTQGGRWQDLETSGSFGLWLYFMKPAVLRAEISLWGESIFSPSEYR